MLLNTVNSDPALHILRFSWCGVRWDRMVSPLWVWEPVRVCVRGPPVDADKDGARHYLGGLVSLQLFICCRNAPLCFFSFSKFSFACSDKVFLPRSRRTDGEGGSSLLKVDGASIRVFQQRGEKKGFRFLFSWTAHECF